MAACKREDSQAPEANLPPGLVDPEGPGGVSGCDLKLLRTGDHSDVLVSCEDREFQVHRAILASRSQWFQRLLAQIGQQPQQPGVLPTLVIASHKSRDVELVLDFIYRRKVDLELSPDISFTSFCVRLFELGCDFSVLGMADFATDEMGNYLSLALQMINDQRLSRRKVLPSGRTVIQDRLRENNFMSLFLLGVEAADAIRLHAGHENRIRPFQMLVDFFIAGKEILLAEPEMELFLDDDVVPAFARAVLLTERRGGARSKWMKNLVARPPAVVKGRSGLCCACGRGLKNISETGGPGLVNPRSRIVTYAQVCCASCSDKEKNVGEHGLVKWEVFDPEKE